MKKNILGRKGEDLAVEFLIRRGYRILERNFRTSFGEIDIIAKDRHAICFVEVRTRTSDGHGHPFESISKIKRIKLTRTALSYLQSHDLFEAATRFDVVAVIPEDQGRYKIEVMKNAFEAGE
ncbi:MAG TPA: YraN family protein [Candidatus Omnitrophica bacterium]|nr:YraN family protein [Candidatus Omnitrophota bacterium]